jgi:DNA-directed RNA polymerase specialized sigma24 family protein
MAVSLEAVKSLLFRARENLKIALEKLNRGDS